MRIGYNSRIQIALKDSTIVSTSPLRVASTGDSKEGGYTIAKLFLENAWGK